MTPHSFDGMAEATRLTREGRLQDAAVLLQRLLAGDPPPAPSPTRQADATASTSPPGFRSAPRSAASARTPFRRFDIDPATGAVTPRDTAPAAMRTAARTEAPQPRAGQADVADGTGRADAASPVDAQPQPAQARSADAKSRPVPAGVAEPQPRSTQPDQSALHTRPTQASSAHPQPHLAQATSLLRPGLAGLHGPLLRPGTILHKRAPGVGRTARPEPAIPAGARFERLRLEANGDARDYRLYIPSSATAGEALPLVVMLHGCTQNPEDFAQGTRMNALAEEHGLLVAYPAQPRSANAQGCWNWFRPGDQARNVGEPALLAGMVRAIQREHGADPARSYVTGLSAGGAAAAILGLAYPELFAAVGVHSGLACGAARDIPSAFAAMQGNGPAPRPPGPADARRTPPLILFHADQDGTVHPRNGQQVEAQFATDGLEATEETGAAQGGHRFTRVLHRDAAGVVRVERWTVHGGGHAWSGGSPEGSYTDPRGPDASAAMVRFFLTHRAAG